MKHFSLSNSLAIVGVIINMGLGPTVWAGAEDAAAAAREEARIEREKSAKNSAALSCQSQVDKIAKAKKEFVQACSAAGASSSKDKSGAECRATLNSCDQMGSSELPITFGTDIFDLNLSGGKGKCSDWLYTDYKTELKETERQLKDDQKEIADLKKKQEEADQQIVEKKTKITGEIADAKKKKEQDELEAAKEERELQAKKQQTIDSISEKLSDLQTEILKTMNQKQQLITERANQVEDYKAELLSCKSATLEYEKKVRSNTSAGLANSSLSGSMAKANTRAASIQKDVQEFWQICASKVLKARDNKSKAYDLKLTEYDNAVLKLTEQQQRLNKMKALIESQTAQEQADQAKKKQQTLANYQEEVTRKSKEFEDALNLYNKQTQNLNDSLNKANTAVVSTSNTLTEFKKNKPAKRTTKTVDDVVAAQSEYLDLSCDLVCAESVVGSNAAKKCSTAMAGKSGSAPGDVVNDGLVEAFTGVDGAK